MPNNLRAFYSGEFEVGFLFGRTMALEAVFREDGAGLAGQGK